MQRLDSHKIDTAIKATIHIEIADQRHHPKIKRIRYLDSDNAPAVTLKKIGHIHHKRTIPATMSAGITRIYKHLGHLIGTLKAKKQLFAIPFRIPVHYAFIDPHAAIIVRAPRQCVSRIPSVGQIHTLTSACHLMGKPESPIIADRRDFTADSYSWHKRHTHEE